MKRIQTKPKIIQTYPDEAAGPTLRAPYNPTNYLQPSQQATNSQQLKRRTNHRIRPTTPSTHTDLPAPAPEKLPPPRTRTGTRPGSEAGTLSRTYTTDLIGNTGGPFGSGPPLSFSSGLKYLWAKHSRGRMRCEWSYTSIWGSFLEYNLSTSCCPSPVTARGSTMIVLHDDI